VVFGDIFVCADVCSAVVAVILAKRAEKILVLCYQPFWHKLLTIHAANINKPTLMDMSIAIASKFPNPLTAKVLLGAPNLEPSYFTSNYFILENAVYLFADWTNLALTVGLRDARQTELMSTVCLMRVP